MAINLRKSDRLLVKGIITGMLIIATFIPSLFVLNLVQERKQRQQEIIEEVSSKWAQGQTLAGPFLAVPYSRFELNDDKKPILITRTAYLLPEQLTVNGKIMPELKKRSIYKVALYRSTLNLSGTFNSAELKLDDVQGIHWEKAKLLLGISDVRGIDSLVQGTWQGAPLVFNAGLETNPVADGGISVPVKISPDSGTYSFALPLSLKGSETFSVLPLGKTTDVHLTSPWPSPSFNGKFLPKHQTGPEGFDARWKVLHFNRDFPQVLENEKYAAGDYAFGLGLLQPTDNYAKTERSVKYAILFIGLTFGFFFMLEILLGRRVHAIQYLLVGIALVVFYTLLLSLGEFLTFSISYTIATLSTVGLITWYSSYLFGSLRNGMYIGSFLTLLYAFIYVLIQLEDTALLVGSIGLFALVALAMHLSRKIDWFGGDPVRDEMKA